MTKPKHTPWSAIQESEGLCRVRNAEKTGVAICESIETANLIAAAPDLLGELKNIFLNYRIDSLSPQDNDRIGALLKKLGAI